jgi:hypothetical protein
MYCSSYCRCTDYWKFRTNPKPLSRYHPIIYIHCKVRGGGGVEVCISLKGNWNWNEHGVTTAASELKIYKVCRERLMQFLLYHVAVLQSDRFTVRSNTVLYSDRYLSSFIKNIPPYLIYASYFSNIIMKPYQTFPRLQSSSLYHCKLLLSSCFIGHRRALLSFWIVWRNIRYVVLF